MEPECIQPERIVECDKIFDQKEQALRHLESPESFHGFIDLFYGTPMFGVHEEDRW